LKNRNFVDQDTRPPDFKPDWRRWYNAPLFESYCMEMGLWFMLGTALGDT